MKHVLTRGSALLMCAALFAGCAQTSAPAGNSGKNSTVPGSTVTSNPETTVNSQLTETSDADLVRQLADVSGDDAQAKEIWMNIFEKTAIAYGGNFESGTDGDIYEYQTDGDTGFVENDAHRLYETSRESYVSTEGSRVLGADVMDLDNSDDAFMSGSGVLTQIDGTSSSAVVKLTDTSSDTLRGTVTKVVSDSYDEKSYGAEMIRDAAINGGFARTVDPVDNASLYTFDLRTEDNGYVLSLKVKDLDTFREKASSSSVLVQNLDEKMVIGLDEVTDETYEFRFTKDGVLREVDNTIFHAVYDDGNKTYVNVRNETEIDGLEDKAQFDSAISDFMQKIADGTFKEGSDFQISDWQ